MRKFLVVLVCMVMSLMAYAEIGNLQAYRYYQKYSYESSWSKPIDCDVQIIINTDDDLIYVDSKRLQYYHIIEYNKSYIDSDGDMIIKFRCIDEEGISCSIRLVKRKSGTYQIYIDYANIAWVYDVR